MEAEVPFGLLVWGETQLFPRATGVVLVVGGRGRVWREGMGIASRNRRWREVDRRMTASRRRWSRSGSSSIPRTTQPWAGRFGISRPIVVHRSPDLGTGGGAGRHLARGLWAGAGRWGRAVGLAWYCSAGRDMAVVLSVRCQWAGEDGTDRSKMEGRNRREKEGDLMKMLSISVMTDPDTARATHHLRPAACRARPVRSRPSSLLRRPLRGTLA